MRPAYSHIELVTMACNNLSPFNFCVCRWCKFTASEFCSCILMLLALVLCFYRQYTQCYISKSGAERERERAVFVHQGGEKKNPRQASSPRWTTPGCKLLERNKTKTVITNRALFIYLCSLSGASTNPNPYNQQGEARRRSCLLLSALSLFVSRWMSLMSVDYCRHGEKWK